MAICLLIKQVLGGSTKKTIFKSIEGVLKNIQTLEKERGITSLFYKTENEEKICETTANISKIIRKDMNAWPKSIYCTHTTLQDKTGHEEHTIKIHASLQVNKEIPEDPVTNMLSLPQLPSFNPIHEEKARITFFSAPPRKKSNALVNTALLAATIPLTAAMDAQTNEIEQIARNMMYYPDETHIARSLGSRINLYFIERKFYALGQDTTYKSLSAIFMHKPIPLLPGNHQMPRMPLPADEMLIKAEYYDNKTTIFKYNRINSILPQYPDKIYTINSKGKTDTLSVQNNPYLRKESRNAASTLRKNMNNHKKTVSTKNNKSRTY